MPERISGLIGGGPNAVHALAKKTLYFFVESW